MSAPLPPLPRQRTAPETAADVGRRLDERLAALLPPSPALDLATPGTGLADAAARESVARLLAARATT